MPDKTSDPGAGTPYQDFYGGGMPPMPADSFTRNPPGLPTDPRTESAPGIPDTPVGRTPTTNWNNFQYPPSFYMDQGSEKFPPNFDQPRPPMQGSWPYEPGYEPPGSLPISATDPSGAQIYNNQQYYSPMTGQNYPMAQPQAPAAPKEDWLDTAGHALWNTGQAIGNFMFPATPEQSFQTDRAIGQGIANAFTGTAQDYLGREQQLLSGQMSRPELAGWVGSHMLPGAATAAGRNLSASPESAGIPTGNLSALSMQEVSDLQTSGRITHDQWEAERVRRLQARQQGIQEGTNVIPMTEGERYRAAIARQQQTQPAQPPTSNVVQFPGAAQNPASPVAQAQQPPAVVQFPGAVRNPMEEELRSSLAAWTGRDPASFQNPMQEAQTYLNQLWVRPDLDPTMRSMLGRWAVIHGLTVPDA